MGMSFKQAGTLSIMSMDMLKVLDFIPNSIIFFANGSDETDDKLHNPEISFVLLVML